MAATQDAALPDEDTELSAKYDTPLGLSHGTIQTLKDRIKLHYDLASDYYLSLWYVHSEALGTSSPGPAARPCHRGALRV